ncbi:hypothetical protein [Tranquillimonas alkanivorans]|uniref:Uncharacterized protein n=1 Tax=Tranquillimonas alkanivorans TaxID=441119 RepID=A0A1I5V185_9RHOB|nr:hypothetical protein [Tranquillimonas alkanivorans]SFQ01239.1 hypothetical protein SAMN04488047_12612 [Tranquillimonas alkanivorans]
MDRRVETIIARLRRALEEERDDELGEVRQLLVAIALDPRRRPLAEELAQALRDPSGLGGNRLADRTAQMSEVIKEEVDRLDIEMDRLEEAKSGTWNYLVLGGAGGSLLGFAGALTAGTVSVSPPGAALLGIIALGAFGMRKRTHHKLEQAQKTKQGLEAIARVLDRAAAGG